MLKKIILGTIALGVIVAFIPTPPPSPAMIAPAPVAKAAAPDHRKDVSAGKLAVKLALREPGSAVFGPVWFSAGVVCGTVSARNGFGGMTGQRPFLVAGGVAVFDNNAAWRKRCI